MATEPVCRICDTRADLGVVLRDTFVNADPVDCEPLRFDDLCPRDRFIVWPLPGDNSGNGGFLDGYHLFMKLDSTIKSHHSVEINAIRLRDAVLLDFKGETLVIKIN